MNSHICLPFIFFFASIFGSVTGQNYYCYNENNYTRDSAYGTNLNTLLSSISSNVNSFGFYNASVGQNPDQVNAIILCRADIQLDLCRSCVDNSTRELLQLCPNQKKAVFWHELCTVRYSNTNMFGTLETVFPVIIMRNTGNVSDTDRYSDDLRTLLDKLRGSAASGGPLLKVAADSRTAADFQVIYMMVQCSPDLSSENCSTCLIEAAKNMRGFPEGSRGVRILVPNCNIRFELSRFYDEITLQERVMAATAPPPPPPGKDDNNNNNKTTRIVISVVVSIVGSLILVVCIVIFLRKSRRKQKRRQKLESVEDMSNVESIQYDFEEIRVATNDFSDTNKLGQGGFGGVYMGLLENDQKIAVKRLSRDFGQGDLEFKNEVVLVARLQHRNLVRLLGFSIEGTERLLIYEFVQNASLDRFLFDSTKRSDLDWDRRYKIIVGITKGLLYLHEDSRLRIIHRDLKASNILLDGEMAPKIADFGMARLFVRDETQGNTSRIVGTYGYMAPEYAMHGQFSIKSDAYSFGVLVLEILTGQRNNSFQNREDLISCAWKHWREGTTTNMIDPVLKASSGSIRDILRCFHISLLCVQENAVDRPTMANVALMLNSFSMSLPLPAKPAFFESRSFVSDGSLLQDHNSKEFESSEIYELNISVDSSKHNTSISELHPR